MSYPVDQYTALAKANGQFLLKLTEIARVSGENYAQLGGKAVATYLDQLKELKPGSVPSLASGGVTGLFSEVEKSREASLGKIKAAFDEWQGCCQGVLSQVASPQELTGAVQAWFQPLLTMSASGLEKVKAPTGQTTKVPETV
ncbi:hypothetical protein [Novosphingobium sp. BL-52-GroH]|uniref:hypothetical protein n=1 Tax=Novosphingobium sp. BL-52-GroH TaxID=3349877 RepID=UPI00384E60AE